MAKKKADSAKEKCCGCGTSADSHPMVAVVRNSTGDAFEHQPCCEACWRTPTSRKFKIKGHFFPRKEAKRAVALAGSDIIQQ